MQAWPVLSFKKQFAIQYCSILCRNGATRSTTLRCSESAPRVRDHPRRGACARIARQTARITLLCERRCTPADPAQDIWTLGVMAYEYLTFTNAFPAFVSAGVALSAAAGETAQPREQQEKEPKYAKAKARPRCSDVPGPQPAPAADVANSATTAGTLSLQPPQECPSRLATDPAARRARSAPAVAAAPAVQAELRAHERS